MKWLASVVVGGALALSLTGGAQAALAFGCPQPFDWCIQFANTGNPTDGIDYFLTDDFQTWVAGVGFVPCAGGPLGSYFLAFFESNPAVPVSLTVTDPLGSGFMDLNISTAYSSFNEGGLCILWEQAVGSDLCLFCQPGQFFCLQRDAKPAICIYPSLWRAAGFGSFGVTDPATITVNGTAGAPEVDPAAGAIPLALAGAGLLLLSDRRSRKA